MALVLANRVQETSTTTGTGTLTLAGAVPGFQSFAAGIGAGNTCYYTITSTTGEWEVGIGTVGTGTLARTTLLSSSTGSFVSFTGTLNVFVTYPSEKSVNLDAANIITGYPITVADNVFTLQDNIDPTKQAQFQLSGLLTGTTYVYTLPTSNGGASTLVDLNSAQIINASKTFSGAANIFGSSANTSSVNVASGATTTGLTKTVNIGTGGLSGSTTTITVGATAGTSTTTMNGQTDIGGTTTSVNFARVEGAATGNAPTISAQGSDATIPLKITSKSFGAVNINTGTGIVAKFIDRGTGTVDSPFIFRAGMSGIQGGVLTLPVAPRLQTVDVAGIEFSTSAGLSGAPGGAVQVMMSHTASAVNYLQLTGAATGAGPTISAQGSDANINLKLIPKGTGVLQFGTYTATVLSPTGFITITDAGGTSRRLLVG